MKNPALMLMVALAVVASSLQAQQAAPNIEVTGGDALVKEKGRFKETWVNPDADFTQYHKLYLWVADLQFREADPASTYTGGRLDNTTTVFGLSEQEQEQFRQVFAKTVATELGRSKDFQLVDKLGPDTLIVRATAQDIACFVPPMSVSRIEVYLNEIGSADVQFELIDSVSGVIQARFGERSLMDPPGQIRGEVSAVPVYRKTMWGPIARWSRNETSDLRRALKKAQRDHGSK